MSIPTKISVTQINENDNVAPSVANQPHLDLSANIDNILLYLQTNSINYFDEDDTSNGLVFGHTSGIFRKNSTVYNISSGTVNLTDNAINYVQISHTGHNVMVNTTGFLNNNVPLWKITTSGGAVTAKVDYRTPMYSLPQQLGITDDVQFNNVIVDGTFTISSGNFQLGNDLAVLGNTALGDSSTDIVTINGTTTVNANATFGADVTIGDSVSDTLTVNADSIFNGAITTNSSLTVGGQLTVNGDLVIHGTTTTVNSNTMTLDDPIITLGGDTAPSVDDNKDRGVEFRWHNGTAAKVGFFGWDDSAQKFVFYSDATNTAEVFSGAIGNAQFNTVELTQTTGVAPLIVSSTTEVANLNVELHGGFPVSQTAANNSVIATDNSGVLNAISADANNLGGQPPSYYLDYNNLSNTPSGGSFTVSPIPGNIPVPYYFPIGQVSVGELRTGRTPKLIFPSKVASSTGKSITYTSGTIRIWYRAGAQNGKNLYFYKNGALVQTIYIPNNSAYNTNYNDYITAGTDRTYKFSNSANINHFGVFEDGKVGYFDITVSPGDEFYAQYNSENNNGAFGEFWFTLGNPEISTKFEFTGNIFVQEGNLPTSYSIGILPTSDSILVYYLGVGSGSVPYKYISSISVNNETPIAIGRNADYWGDWSRTILDYINIMGRHGASEKLSSPQMNSPYYISS